MTRDFTFGLGTSAFAHLKHFKGPAFITLSIWRQRVSEPEVSPECDWVGMDSGGYTALKNTGAWPWGIREHASEARRAMRWLGKRLPWVAVQDWMCTPDVLNRTGLNAATHMRRTAQSYADLLHAAPDVPWAPVLQGVTRGDYLRCAEETERITGQSLKSAPAVLLGSIAARCLRRNGEAEPWIIHLAEELADAGLKVHALGAKCAALREFARVGCKSGDSQGWSRYGRTGKMALTKWLKLPDQRKPPPPHILLALAEASVEKPPVGTSAAQVIRALHIAGGKCPANSHAWAEAWRIEQDAYVAEGLALRA